MDTNFYLKMKLMLTNCSKNVDKIKGENKNMKETQ